MKPTQTHYAVLFLTLSVFITTVIISARGSEDGAVTVAGSYASVAPVQFEEMIHSGEYTVIDIRTPEETVLGKVVPDALELDYYQPVFVSQLKALDRNGHYLIYCNSGNRTRDTLQRMRALGFDTVYELKGGKVAWEQSGRTLVSPAENTRSACPADEKLCADGSSVVRIWPDCDFAQCAY